MRLLLDTHALVWWIEDSARLGTKARAAIADANTAVWISAASLWELAIKMGLGRIVLTRPLDVVPPEIQRNGFVELPVSFPHALTAASLPRLHSDPFDRMLIAQAQCEGLTILTADQRIRAYSVPSLDATQ